MDEVLLGSLLLTGCGRDSRPAGPTTLVDEEVSFVADGQRVPEDLHVADRKRLIERAFAPAADLSLFGLTNGELPLVAANSAAAMHDPLLKEVQLG